MAVLSVDPKAEKRERSLADLMAARMDALKDQ
jgi:hypothetical protein